MIITEKSYNAKIIASAMLASVPLSRNRTVDSNLSNGLEAALASLHEKSMQMAHTHRNINGISQMVLNDHGSFSETDDETSAVDNLPGVGSGDETDEEDIKHDNDNGTVVLTPTTSSASLFHQKEEDLVGVKNKPAVPQPRGAQARRLPASGPGNHFRLGRSVAGPGITSSLPHVQPLAAGLAQPPPPPPPPPVIASSGRPRIGASGPQKSGGGPHFTNTAAYPPFFGTASNSRSGQYYGPLPPGFIPPVKPRFDLFDVLITVYWKSHGQQSFLHRCKASTGSLQTAALEFCKQNPNIGDWLQGVAAASKSTKLKAAAAEETGLPPPYFDGPIPSIMPWGGGVLEARVRQVGPDVAGKSSDNGDNSSSTEMVYNVTAYPRDDLTRIFHSLGAVNGDNMVIPKVVVDVQYLPRI